MANWAPDSCPGPNCPGPDCPGPNLPRTILSTLLHSLCWKSFLKNSNIYYGAKMQKIVPLAKCTLVAGTKMKFVSGYEVGRSIYHTIIPVWFLAREVPRGYQIPNVRGTRFIPVLFMLQQWHIFVRHQMCHMVIDCCFAKLAISPNIVLCQVWQALSWGINYSSLKLCFQIRISQKICLSNVRLSEAKAKNKYC